VPGAEAGRRSSTAERRDSDGRIAPSPIEVDAAVDGQEACVALTEALSLARMGLSVIPLRPGSKVPAVRWKRWQSERPSEAQIMRWWREVPERGVAIVTGGVSGVVSVDRDGPAGEAALRERYLPPTAVLETPRGRHYLFALPEGVTLRRRIGLLREVDLLAEGSHSAIYNGDGRRWAPGLSPEEAGFAPCPDWLLELAQAPTAAPAAPPDSREAIPKGHRNSRLFLLACRLRREGAPESEAQAALVEMHQRCEPGGGFPWTLEQLQALVDRVWRTYPLGPEARQVRVPRKLCNAGVGLGAKALWMARTAWRQVYGQAPRTSDLATVLRCSGRTVERRAGELRAAGLEELARPGRSYGLLPAVLVLDPTVPYQAKAVALRLAVLSTRGEARVGMSALARGVGLSPRQTAAYVQVLESGGHLEVHRAPYDPCAGRRLSCNVYRFLNGAARMATSLLEGDAT